MHKIVLLRHGESTWNRENRFTGWTDVDLSPRGREEAELSAAELKKNNFTFDLAFTSVLKRALKTLYIVLEQLDLLWIPVVKSWRLNERHYGALQGLNKQETAQKYGEEQVLIWRRSYETRPPLLDPADERCPGREAKYALVPQEDLPLGECLKDTVERFLPFWRSNLAPAIKTAKKVLIAAHGNSLRALVQYLDHLSPDKIMGLNIPTGIPLVYELDDDLKPLKHYYLAEEDEVKKAMNSVAGQGKVK